MDKYYYGKHLLDYKLIVNRKAQVKIKIYKETAKCPISVTHVVLNAKYIPMIISNEMLICNYQHLSITVIANHNPIWKATYTQGGKMQIFNV